MAAAVAGAGGGAWVVRQKELDKREIQKRNE